MKKQDQSDVTGCPKPNDKDRTAHMLDGDTTESSKQDL